MSFSLFYDAFLTFYEKIRTICYIQLFMLILVVIFIFAIYGLFDELWLIYFLHLL